MYVFEPPSVDCAIVPGLRARTVHVATETEIALIAPPSSRFATAGDLAKDFVEGFAVGCFTGRVESARVVSDRMREVDGIRVEGFELALPIATSAPIRVLLASVESSAVERSGIRKIEVSEVANVSEQRVGRGELELGTSAIAPFALDREVGDTAKDVRFELTFEKAVDDATVSAARRMMKAWSALLWGFPADDSPTVVGWGWGFVTDVDRHVSNTIVAAAEGFFGSEASWSALTLGLIALHATSRMTGVEIY